MFYFKEWLIILFKKKMVDNFIKFHYISIIYINLLYYFLCILIFVTNYKHPLLTS